MGDSTGTVKAFFPDSEHIFNGNTVVIFNAMAHVDEKSETIEIQRDPDSRRFGVQSSRRIIEGADVNNKFNLSDKRWERVE